MGTFVLEDLARRDRGDGVPEDDARSTASCSTPTRSWSIKARVDGRDDTPKLMAMEITRPEINIDGAQPLTLRRQGGRAHRRAGRRGCASCCARTPARARCSCASSAPRRRPCSASATSSAARRATASTPSSESSSAPTASPDRPGSNRRSSSHGLVTRHVDAGSHGFGFCTLPDANRDPGGDRARRGAGWRRGSRASVTKCCSARGRSTRREQSVAELNEGVGRPGRGPASRATTRGRATRRSWSSRCTPTPRSRPCRSTPSGCQGKIVVSMANNLVKHGNEFNAVLPPHGSVAAEIQALLWRSHVCTAFHLVPAAEFADARPRDGERRGGARRRGRRQERR